MSAQSKIRLSAPAGDQPHECRASIEFFVIQEYGAYVAYCPSLDLSTCAASYNEAIGNFYEMFQLHIECCLANGTLQADLLSHGWRLGRAGLLPPKFAVLMRKPEMRRLMDGRIGFEKVVSPVRIPAMA